MKKLNDNSYRDVAIALLAISTIAYWLFWFVNILTVETILKVMV